MATNYKIKLKRFNGTDYDTLNLLASDIIMNDNNTVQFEIEELQTDKQDLLISGTNIKTIGGQSVLGSGDVEVGGALYFTNISVSATTGNIVTITNSNITSDHVVASVAWNNPTYITNTNITWTTTNGSLVLNGTCTSATTAEIVLVKENN